MKSNLVLMAAKAEAGETIEQPQEESLTQARKQRRPRVPENQPAKAAKLKEKKASKKAAATEDAGDARKLELAAIRERLEAAMPHISRRSDGGYDVAGEPSLGARFSTDIRVIASSRVPRICSGCSKLVEVGSPLVQWTSSQPGNEKGYMFRGECCLPAPEDLENTVRVATPKAPRPPKGGAMPLATLLEVMVPCVELGEDPASLGSVKVSAYTVEQIVLAMGRAGIKSQADFRRMAYRYFAEAVLTAS